MKPMHRCVLMSILLLAVIWSFGCGSPTAKGPATAKVSGTVKMDGKAVPTGEIHFGVPGFPPSVLEITDGKYAGEAPVGKNEVQVFIYIESAPIQKYGGERIKTNTTPQKYWGPKSILEATVDAQRANELDFKLTSK